MLAHQAGLIRGTVASNDFVQTACVGGTANEPPPAPQQPVARPQVALSEKVASGGRAKPQAVEERVATEGEWG